MKPIAQPAHGHNPLRALGVGFNFAPQGVDVQVQTMGIFQVDELRKEKLRSSGVEAYVAVESEKHLIRIVNLLDNVSAA
ncbi:MAG: hypothetical protein ABI874_01725 [Chloroflexota bacterium]